MNDRYIAAIVLAVIAFGSAAVIVLTEAPWTLLVLTLAALPIAVFFAVWGRLGGELPMSAAVGGAVGGVVVAVVAGAAVLAFSYAFLSGFVDAFVDILEDLRVDPALTEVLGSPWVVLLGVTLVVVAPLTEEFGKAAGAAVSKPATRRQAFLAGVAAGVGFAVVENLLYASGGFFFGDASQILLARSLGAAVHPLASGLVVMGWWEWRNGRGISYLVRGYLGGVGVHALWNASLVALTVTETTYDIETTPEALAAVSLAYSAALGAVAAAALWRATSAVASDRDPLSEFEFESAWSLTGWTVLTATFLVPVVMLILAFPGFG